MTRSSVAASTTETGWPPRSWLVAVPAAVVLAVVMLFTQHGLSWWMTDANVYRAAGRLVWHGGRRLYDFALPNGNAPLWFNYPPFAALLLAPFTLLPADAMAVLLIAVKLLILLAVVRRTLDRLGVPLANQLRLTVISGLLLCTIDPVAQDIQVGNINIFVLLLAFLDLTLPSASRWKGVGLGLAIGLKVTPALFVLYLLLTRQFRAARTAVATFAVTVVLGLVLLPGASVRYWTSALWDTSRVFPVPAFTGNQSLHGVVLRLLGTGSVAESVWLVLAVGTVAGGLAVAVGLYRRGADLEGVLVCAVVVLLVTPISWSHHWVWGVPAIVVLWTHARRARSALLWVAAAFVVVMFSARLYIFATPNLDFRNVSQASFAQLGVVPQLMSASLVGAGVLLIVLAELHRRRLPVVQ